MAHSTQDNKVLNLALQHPILTLLLGLALYAVKRLFYNWHFSHHRQIRGPSRSSIIWGGMKELISENDMGKKLEELTAEYGDVFRMAGPFGLSRIIINDERAIRYVFQEKSYSYPKPKMMQRELMMLVGDGILTAEGHTHKKHKRLLGPAFSQARVDSLAPIFLDHSQKLANQFKRLSTQGPAEVDVVEWYSRLTFDIIGLAGFGQDFRTIDGKVDAETEQLAKLMQGQPMAFNAARAILQPVLLYFPFLMDYIPLPRLKKARGALRLLRKKFEGFYQEMRNAPVSANNKDLLSLLIRANAAEEPKHQLSDVEVRDNATTFLFAGSETTSTALSWASLYLAQHQDVQDRLRQEVLDFQKKGSEAGIEIDIHQITALPYLSAFVKEVFRYRPPVGGLIRVASEDDIIPLSSPIRLKNGQLMHQLKVKKNDLIGMGIPSLNSHPGFGKDVDEFDPSRWLSPFGDDLAENRKGTWSQLTTFNQGPRVCIGFRFAIAEFTLAIYTLVSQIKFSEIPDKPIIVGRSEIVTRPFVEGQYDKSRMPLILEAV